MEAGHDQGERDAPKESRHQHGLPRLVPGSDRGPLRQAVAFADPSPQWVRLLSAAPSRAEPEHPGHRHERQLRAGMEDLVGIEGQQHQGRSGQRIEAHPLSAPGMGRARRQHQDHRPHDRRLGVGQKRIEHGQARDQPE
jgi:hypothetical protein